MRQTVLPGGIGLGLHPFRGLAVIEDFEAVRLPIDVAEFDTDAVDWMPERLDFLIDGNVIRGCLGPAQSPTQMMVAVSTSRTARPTGGDSDAVPGLITDYRRRVPAITTSEYGLALVMMPPARRTASNVCGSRREDHVDEDPR